MILVFFGTLYQVDHGIWLSQQRFFYSWVIMWHNIPCFPGGRLVLGVLFVNLLAALLFRIHVSWRSLGLGLVHVGLLLLLAGGWFTHSFAEDSFLTLAEGETSNVTLSYRKWELSLWKEKQSPFNVVAVDTASFRPGTLVDFGEFECRIQVESYYGNSVLVGPDFQRLEEVKRENDPQNDIPGAVLDVMLNGKSERITISGAHREPTMIGEGDNAIFISLRRKRIPMPILITLNNFEKEYYPGSSIPAAFSSEIEVDIEGVKRTVLIEMNEPFRFNEYTFYQASFGSIGNAELSTFSVTQNYGRLIPYVAITLTVLGLIVHFISDLAVRSRMARRQLEGKA